MNEIFTIGAFCFRLIWPEEMALPENFLKFRGGSAPTYTYTITLADVLPQLRGTVAARRSDILVLRDGELEIRYLGVKGQPMPYACYQERSAGEATITLLTAWVGDMELDVMFLSLLALERRQLERDGLILHCAYVEYQGEAILFSAPSETGKTTQANLWERFRGARTVNGDRALVRKTGGRWCAEGWPVCGSSGVCENRALPIRAVVMLSQAPADRADRLTPMKAFAQIYSQITVNRWDASANLRAMALIEQLATEIPVFHLACTMDETAVETLEMSLGC